MALSDGGFGRAERQNGGRRAGEFHLGGEGVMEHPSRYRVAWQWFGFFAGPVLAAATYGLLPAEYRSADGSVAAMGVAGRVTLAVMAWMATWWLTEAIDISATALLPLVLLPVFGAADIKAAAAPYAHPLIFLFLGGFLIALAMQRWGLDRRIALTTLRLVGVKPANMVGGFMLATAGLSAFVSNTATTAIMLPIAISVIQLVRKGGGSSGAKGRAETPSEKTGDQFALCLMLGIAYAASLGGIATIIGTPPNAFLAGFVRDAIAPEYRMEVSFARWLLIGLPLTVVFLPLVWVFLTRVLYPLPIRRIEGGEALLEAELKSLGRISGGEWATLIVFLLTATCWIARPLLAGISWTSGGRVVQPLAGLTDPTIAMIGGISLFVIPLQARPRRFVMEWKDTQQLPWGILVLFGGGLSLAAAVQANGVAQFIGSQTTHFAGLPPLLIVLAVSAAVIFLTELTSNTATTATLLPLLAALAPGLGVHPYLLIFPAAIAASCAFMMPVATPPNAIVFASGEVTIPQMAKAGLWLNVVGVVLITLLAAIVLGPVLGVDLGIGL